MHISAVLFDMDGVLLDSEPLHHKVNSIIYQSLDIHVDQSIINEFVGRTSTDRWTSIKDRFQLSESVEELSTRQWEDLVTALPASGVGPSDGLYKLLCFLKQKKIRASIASSSKRSFVEAVMDHLGIREDMEGYTCADEVTNCKPEPDIFLLAAEKMGVTPLQCMVIEDSSAGVSAAKAAGMFTVGYDNPTSEGQDLSQADIRVNHLADICGILLE